MSDFNPDAFLATPQASGTASNAFDPDAFLAGRLQPGAKAKASPQEVSILQAIASGAGQGAFGLGDELGALGQAIAAGSAEHQSPIAMDKAFADTYRQARAENRQIDEAARTSQPWAYYPALIASSIATGGAIPVGQVAKGASLLRRIAQGVKAGAASGAVTGLGTSEADLTRPSSANLLRTGLQTGLSTLGGGVVGGLATAAVAPLQRLLRAKAIEAGRKALTNGADSLSRRAPIPEPAVEEAIQSGGLRMLGTTEGALGRLEGLTEEQGARYADLVNRFEKEGVPGPDAVRIALHLVKRAKELEPNTMVDAVPALYREAARKAIEKANPETFTLGLTQNEGLKSSLQDPRLYNKVADINLGPERREIASVFRQASEDAISRAAQAAPENQTLQTLNQEFVPVKQRLGRLIEARNAAERGAARAAQRGHIGPIEAMAGAAQLSRGDPHGLLKAAEAIGITKLLRSRGPSTAAAGLYGLQKPLGYVGARPASAGLLESIIQNALQQDGAQE